MMVRTWVFVASVVVLCTQAFGQRVWVMADCDSNWKPPFGDSLQLFDAQGRMLRGSTGFNTFESMGAGRQINAHTADGSCWTTELGAHHVKRSDMNGAIRADFPVDVLALDVTASGVIYAISTAHSVIMMDQKGAIIHELPLDGQDLVVDTVHGYVWVAGYAIARLDLNLQERMYTDPITWYAVSVDYDTDGTAWILERQSESMLGHNRILHIASRGNILDTIPLPESSFCVRADRSRRILWVAGATGLFRYDIARHTLGLVDSGQCWQVEIDDSSGTVWLGGRSALRSYTSDGVLLTNHPFSGSHIHFVSITRAEGAPPPLDTPAISYIIPDEAAPGMNSYVELIGQYDRDSLFGEDGIFANNPGDSIEVICANVADRSKVVIGPIVLSWNGKMISTQVFVMPDVKPNSWDWRLLAPQFRIPIHVLVHGVTTDIDTLYIVQPQTFGVKNTVGVIGSGGAWGLRSRRGAMIVDSMILDANDSYSISTADCDPSTSGNQGYLPVNILSVGEVRMARGATIVVDANGMDGGPGGGGGGGVWNDSDGAVGAAGHPTVGGAGFTGGEGGTLAGGQGSGGDGQASGSVGGFSLNGMPGGAEKPGSLKYLVSRYGRAYPAGHEGTGGGSGFPFGTSGEGGLTANCDQSNTFGGYSGGSGAGQCDDPPSTKTAFGGGGGGNTRAGLSNTSGGGSPSGNEMLVPFSGGSGGGGGNAYDGVAGFGGGGGGAIALFASRFLTAGTLSARGADGGNTSIRNTSYEWSGAGGAGSGGAIFIAAKQLLATDSLSVDGGRGGRAKPRSPQFPQPVQDGGDGGAGRVRFDGPLGGPFPDFTPLSASAYVGPSTDTTSWSTSRTITLSGTGNGNDITLWIKPQSGSWGTLATITNYLGQWARSFTLPGNDTVYFVCAAQHGSGQSTSRYSMVPSWVLSQAAANIIRIGALSLPVIASALELRFALSLCDSLGDDTVWVHNTGAAPLKIGGGVITGANAADFLLTEPPGFPVQIPPGDSAPFVVRFRPSGPGTRVAELALSSNDNAHQPWRIQLAGTRDTASATVRIDTISANVGDMVAISVNLSSSGNMGPCFGTSAAYELRYDRSLLVPLNAPSGVDVGRDRILSLTATRTQATGALDTLRFIATLGDTDRTPLHFESFTWLDGGVTTTTIDGMFLLKNICQQGGARYVTIGSTAGLAQNAPNPFVDETAIRFRTNEPGPVKIIITDILGREVERVCDEQFPAGEYTCAVKGGRFAAGLYVCTMETPGFRRSVRMMKCR